MILLALVAVFLYVVATGPAGIEWRAKRQARLDAPLAKVYYLPSACCQVGPAEPVEDTIEAELRRQRLEREARIRRDNLHRMQGCLSVFPCPICDV